MNRSHWSLDLSRIWKRALINCLPTEPAFGSGDDDNKTNTNKYGFGCGTFRARRFCLQKNNIPGIDEPDWEIHGFSEFKKEEKSHQNLGTQTMSP